MCKNSTKYGITKVSIQIHVHVHMSFIIYVHCMYQITPQLLNEVRFIVYTGTCTCTHIHVHNNTIRYRYILDLVS